MLPRDEILCSEQSVYRLPKEEESQRETSTCPFRCFKRGWFGAAGPAAGARSAGGVDGPSVWPECTGTLETVAMAVITVSGTSIARGAPQLSVTLCEDLGQRRSRGL